jgi:hypothetical protein
MAGSQGWGVLMRLCRRYTNGTCYGLCKVYGSQAGARRLADGCLQHCVWVGEANQWQIIGGSSLNIVAVLHRECVDMSPGLVFAIDCCLYGHLCETDVARGDAMPNEAGGGPVVEILQMCSARCVVTQLPKNVLQSLFAGSSTSGLVLLEPSGLAVQNAEWQVGTLLSLSPW